MPVIHLLLPILVGSALGAIGQGTAQQSPCATPAHREFDFWVGEWDVRLPNGTVAGVNRITREYGGCVLHERYTTPGGFTGESLNSYDVGRKVWHQTWVDNSGTLLLIEGGLQGANMVLSGQTTDSTGRVTRHRITYTPSPDGTLRQLWESTDASGNWTVAFDGRYTRR